AYNTDAAGFIRPIKKRISDLSSARAAVLGTGGAARAAIYALREEGAEVTLFGRNQAKAAELSKEFATSFVNCDVSSDRLDFRDFDIVVNATPIGSKNSKYSFNQHCHFRGVKIVYDLVYVPKLTAFLETGIRAGAEPIFGKEMLLEQAALQFEIWHGRSAPFEVMQAAIESL
ncbi:MAG TPA: hypothetical protein VNK26_06490, partial [Pyrinomonadaceae bacterium]|nr:hypothetical protein [Pyrinomonadaceae bacterium]